jgi:hypothetical protein
MTDFRELSIKIVTEVEPGKLFAWPILKAVIRSRLAHSYSLTNNS